MCTAYCTTGAAFASKGIILTEPRSVLSRSVSPSDVVNRPVRSVEVREPAGSPDLVSPLAGREGSRLQTGIAAPKKTMAQRRRNQRPWRAFEEFLPEK